MLSKFIQTCLVPSKGFDIMHGLVQAMSFPMVLSSRFATDLWLPNV